MLPFVQAIDCNIDVTQIGPILFNSFILPRARPDKRYIATAARGPNSVIVVWDAQSGTPIKTFFDVRSCTKPFFFGV